MWFPSRREASMPVSASRTSWLETAWGFIPSVRASSVTVASPFRTRWCRSRRRVSLARTLNRAMTLTASTKDSSGRSFRAGRGGQHAPADAGVRRGVTTAGCLRTMGYCPPDPVLHGIVYSCQEVCTPHSPKPVRMPLTEPPPRPEPEWVVRRPLTAAASDRPSRRPRRSRVMLRSHVHLTGLALAFGLALAGPTTARAAPHHGGHGGHAGHAHGGGFAHHGHGGGFAH